jgi:microcystin-dependent protein
MKSALIFISILVISIIYLVTRLVLLQYEPYENLEAKTNITSIYNEKKLYVTDINVSGAFNILPTGSIVMWTKREVPAGWAICDGTNKTPDMRKRFVVGTVAGADGSKAEDLPNGERYPGEFQQIGSQGGEETHLLNEKEIPEHSHAHSVFQGRQYLKNVAVLLGNVLNGINGGTYDVNSLSHSGSIPEYKKQTPHNNMPPYYVLYYIMKL